MANGNEQILDDIENEEDAQINQEEYELWCLQAELSSMSEEEREANDAACDAQMADMLSMYEAEMKAYKIEIADKFREFLYNNYTIGNGEQLLRAEEDGIEDFLRENDLPPDMEIEL